VQQQVWAELWVKGLSSRPLAATAAAVASKGQTYSTQQQQHSSSAVTSSSTGSGLGAIHHVPKGNTEQLQGDAHHQPVAGAAPVEGTPGYWQQHSTSGSWLPQRQRDTAELLLRHGLARLSDAEDVEWLGMRQSRWTAYCRWVRGQGCWRETGSNTIRAEGDPCLSKLWQHRLGLVSVDWYNRL
jgi:hypothetical protein